MPYEDGIAWFASSELQATPTRAINAGLFVFSLSLLSADGSISYLALRVACPLFDFDGSRLHCAALYCLVFGKRYYNCISYFKLYKYSLHSPKFPRSYHSITRIRLPVSHADTNDHAVSVAPSDLHHGLAR